MKKIQYIFLGWFSSSWNDKKNDVKKKKKKKQKLEWATAHLDVESRYTVLYHDRHGLGASGGLAWGKSRYNGLYRGLGQPLCHNRGSNTSCDTAAACYDTAGQARDTA